MDDKLLEPLLAFKQSYKGEFDRNAEEYFDALVKKAGVDVEQNRKTVRAYNAENAKAAAERKRLSAYNAWRVVTILLMILGAFVALGGILALVQGETVAGAVMLSVGVAVAVAMIPALVKGVLPVLKQADAARRLHEEKAAALMREASAQMAPLNALFDDGATKQLVEKTVPLIHLDDNFNMRRYEHLREKYGFGDPTDDSRSVIGLLSGEIVGNPFIVRRDLVEVMGSYTYTGSIIITWTTSYVDSEGHVHTEHHSQTLTASLTRPKPYYSEQTCLIYGNEAAPDLHFSRTPTHAEKLDEGQLERKVKSGKRKLRKKQEKALAAGGQFTEMGNDTFDVLFGALDRDNEVQFRLLFTPLAQKNMLALMRDPAGFGDDFRMSKAGCLNFVSSEHSAQWDIETDCTRYYSYSVDLSRKQFLEFNRAYFKSLYFELAPLMSIPLYQQYKPHEYIYRDVYPMNFNPYETEYAANRVGQRAFSPAGAATPSILKTEYLSGDGKTDLARVTAYAFAAYDRVDFVPVFGGDGNMHEVPVPWVEYVPIEGQRDVKLKELGFTDREFSLRSGEGKLREALSRHGKGAYGYGHGILCCLAGDGDDGFDADFDKSIRSE